jgi:putative thiamine transport system permease protein
VQLALVVFGLAIWRGAEALGHRWLMALTQGGVRGRGLDVVLGPLAAVAAAGLALVAVMGLAGLALWSLAGPWPFPLALPRTLGLSVWARAAPDLARTTATSLALAGTTTLAAVLLTLAALQGEGRDNRVRRVEALVYLPLIVPQVVFLPGIAVALLTLPVPPVLAVAAAHLVFVLPYVFLSLAGPFRAWDGRMGAVATTLGAGPWRILLRLRLPMLAAPLAAAAAIGVAVSIGQYLPTLLLGGGRVATLTTEAVALASGSNRRIVGAYGLMQAVWPALAFALARRVKAA